MGRYKSKGKYAVYTKYSDFIILSEVENKNHKDLSAALHAAADILGLRFRQVTGRFYKVLQNNFTVKDVQDWTQEDKDAFHPGGEPVDKTIVAPANRPSFPGGYNKFKSSVYKKNTEVKPEPVANTIELPPNSPEPIREYFNGYNDGYQEAYDRVVVDIVHRILGGYTTNEQKLKIVKTIMKDL